MLDQTEPSSMAAVVGNSDNEGDEGAEGKAPAVSEHKKGSHRERKCGEGRLSGSLGGCVCIHIYKWICPSWGHLGAMYTAGWGPSWGHLGAM